jgi:hypothetical protein
MQPNDDREVQLDPALDNHIIATSAYQNFPSFTTGAPYDDTLENAEVPSVVGLTSTAAKAAITAAGLNWAMTTTGVGATLLNNDKIKTQTPAAGTLTNVEELVSIVSYAYVEPATTGPIAGFNRNAGGTGISLNGDDTLMYVVGRTVKPTVGTTISVSGASVSTFNRNWTVVLVQDDNSYNTGGTVVKLTSVEPGTFTGTTATGGTWGPPVTGVTVSLNDLSTVSQSTSGGMAPLLGRARLVDVVGGEEGGALFTAAAANGLVGKTIAFSGDVATSSSAYDVSGFAGQTFVITASSSSRSGGPGPVRDRVNIDWAPVGTNQYQAQNFTAGTATIAL